MAREARRVVSAMIPVNSVCSTGIADCDRFAKSTQYPKPSRGLLCRFHLFKCVIVQKYFISFSTPTLTFPGGLAINIKRRPLATKAALQKYLYHPKFTEFSRHLTCLILPATFFVFLFSADLPALIFCATYDRSSRRRRSRSTTVVRPVTFCPPWRTNDESRWTVSVPSSLRW